MSTDNEDSLWSKQIQVRVSRADWRLQIGCQLATDYRIRRLQDTIANGQLQSLNSQSSICNHSIDNRQSSIDNLLRSQSLSDWTPRVKSPSLL